MRTPTLLICAVGLLAFTNTGIAGTYNYVYESAILDPNGAGSDPEDVLPLFAIMHPTGYDGTGGTVSVTLCTPTGSERLDRPLQRAIDVWNDLTPTTSNCENCFLFEESFQEPQGRVRALTTLIHELGHCAMGLDHINLGEYNQPPWRRRTGRCDANQNNQCGDETSHTASINVTTVVSGTGTPLGDSEDMHLTQCQTGNPLEPGELVPPAPNQSRVPDKNASQSREDEFLLGLGCSGSPACCPACPGPQCPTTAWRVEDLSWFRVADNNPFTIDSTVIDLDSFSRSSANLPAGHNYITNGNRGVGDDLGLSDTQSVMYSGIANHTFYTGITTDDVNMVKMAMTGADRDAGSVDDYTVELSLIDDCSQADIWVRLENVQIPVDRPDLKAVCLADFEDSFPQGQISGIHHSLVPAGALSHLFVELNATLDWDFRIENIFDAGFESGDLSEWTSSMQ